MKILITGADNSVGAYLLKELLQRGEQVRVLLSPTESATMLLKEGAEIIRGDITDARTLGPVVQDVEVVWHLAELKNVHRSLIEHYLVNVTGTENLYRAAQAAGARRFVYNSSHVIYGLGRECVLREADALRPDGNAFSLSKAASDHLIRRFMLSGRMETVIVRPTVPCGPGDDQFFAVLIRRMQTGKITIIGRGDNVLPLCSVADVVQGLLLAGYHQAAVGNVYNISNDRPLTQQECMEACVVALGGTRPFHHVSYLPRYYGSMFAEKVLARLTLKQMLPTWLDMLLWGTENRYSIEKARRELGYIPRDDLSTTIQMAATRFNCSDAHWKASMQKKSYMPLATVYA